MLLQRLVARLQARWRWDHHNETPLGGKMGSEPLGSRRYDVEDSRSPGRESKHTTLRGIRYLDQVDSEAEGIT
jgi:hypothetical protein